MPFSLKFKEITVYNFRIAYVATRIFSLVWLIQILSIYHKNSARNPDFYEPILLIQKCVMPIFPSPGLYYSAVAVFAALVIISIFRYSWAVNVLIFLLACYFSLPDSAYMSVGHHNHLLLIYFFITIFINPFRIRPEDYIAVVISHLSLLGTYSLAGLWKVLSILGDIFTKSPSLSWIEPDAARYNTLVNYFMIDKSPPAWMMDLYGYQNFWIILTAVGILMQTLCFLGAFNRRILTVSMLFLVAFHLYTKYFVLADWRIMIFAPLIMFFPYHIFRAKSSANNSMLL